MYANYCKYINIVLKKMYEAFYEGMRVLYGVSDCCFTVR